MNRQQVYNILRDKHISEELSNVLATEIAAALSAAPAGVVECLGPIIGCDVYEKKILQICHDKSGKVCHRKRLSAPAPVVDGPCKDCISYDLPMLTCMYSCKYRCGNRDMFVRRDGTGREGKESVKGIQHNVNGDI